MIKRISVSLKDKKMLAGVSVDPSTQMEDNFDYSNVVIKKPWGYEYLIFKNKEAAVWVLHLNKGYSTSTHCHPNKKTSLTVLAGEVKCRTLDTQYSLGTGEGLLIDKGVFHCTEALSPEEVVVMEVETPINKQDLVRLHDLYGRSGKRYEGQEHHQAFDESICHFNNPDGRFNCSKKFGECEVTLVSAANSEELKNVMSSYEAHTAAILKGSIDNAVGRNIMEVGDSIYWQDLRAVEGCYIKEDTEFLLVKKNN